MIPKSLSDADSLTEETEKLKEESTEEEDEQETHINSNGSVLMPSDAPYDKFEKIKEANSELFSTIITKPKSPCKVHFNPSIITHSIACDELAEETVLTEIEEDSTSLEEIELNTSTESCSSSDSSSTIICKSTKLLLVTVPTAFTEQVDDEDGEDVELVDEEDEVPDYPDVEIEEVTDDTYCEDNDCQSSVKILDEQLEEETEIEELSEECIDRPSSILHHHKPVLTKGPHIEEDSESDTDVPSPNSFTSYNRFELRTASIEDLTENFNDCSISTQIEIENAEESGVNKKKQTNDSSTKEPLIISSVGVKTNSESKTKKDERKTMKKNSHSKAHMKKSESVSPSVRAQCPIYQRTYGLFSLKKEGRSKSVDNRPSTAPTKRHCCNYWEQGKLPEYNGLRSEYGLSAEQLLQRKRDKLELAKMVKLEKEQKYLDEIRKQKENDLMFNSWLVKKKKEAAQKYSRKKLPSTFQFKSVTASTKHLDRVGALRKKLLKREHTSYSLEEFFKNANPHEQKTYRIYLGLCIE